MKKTTLTALIGATSLMLAAASAQAFWGNNGYNNNNFGNGNAYGNGYGNSYGYGDGYGSGNADGSGDAAGDFKMTFSGRGKTTQHRSMNMGGYGNHNAYGNSGMNSNFYNNGYGNGPYGYAPYGYAPYPAPMPAPAQQ